jgi:hypothetical protein
LKSTEHNAAISRAAADAARKSALDEMFPRNTVVSSNGDLKDGWELNPKALFKLKKEIESNPQFTEEPEAEVIETVVLAIMQSLRKGGKS